MAFTKLKKWGPWLLVLGLAIALGLAHYSGQKTEQALLVEKGLRQAETLRASGWQKIATELTEVTLPDLEDQLQAASQSGSEPLIRTRVVTERVEVPVDREVYVEVPQECRLDLGTRETEEPAPLTVGVSSDLQLALDLTADGEVYYTGKLFTTLSGPLFPDDRVIEQPLTQSSAIAVSPNLQEIVMYYNTRPKRLVLGPRPMKHWRVGLSAGLGLVVGPQGEVQAGLAMLWGVQF